MWIAAWTYGVERTEGIAGQEVWTRDAAKPKSADLKIDHYIKSEAEE